MRCLAGAGGAPAASAGTRGRTAAGRGAGFARLRPGLFRAAAWLALAVTALLVLPAGAAAQENQVGPTWSLTPSGLADGDRFRLIFVSSTSRNATSSNIDDRGTEETTRSPATAPITTQAEYCAEPDLSGRVEVWSAVMNPGEVGSAPDTLGYDADLPGGGTLSDDTFTFDDENLTITNLFTDPPLLLITFNGDLSDRGYHTIRLHVCSDTYDFASTRYGIGSGDELEWGESGIDWSGRAVVHVAMSVPTSHAPWFAHQNVHYRFEENTPAGEAVGDPVTAIDWGGDTITYEMTGTDAAAFSIEDDTGQIRTVADTVYDYETHPDAYEVTVTASTNGDSATTNVKIRMNNVPEKAGTPQEPTVSATAQTLDSLDVTWLEADPMGGPEIVSYNVQHRMVGASDWEDFAPVDTGTSHTIPGLDRDTEYEVQVQAVNGEISSDWSPAEKGRTNGLNAIAISANYETIGAGLEDLVLTVTRSGTITEALDATVTFTRAQTGLWLTRGAHFEPDESETEMTVNAASFSLEAMDSGTLTIVASAPGIATDTQTTVTVIASDAPPLTISYEHDAYTLAEDGVAQDTPIKVSVTLHADYPRAPRRGLSVAVGATDGSATHAEDYETLEGTLEFAASDFVSNGTALVATKGLAESSGGSVDVVNDNIYEGSETFDLRLSPGTGTRAGLAAATKSDGTPCDACATVTITDEEDLPTLTLTSEPTSISEVDDSTTTDLAENTATVTASITNGKTFAGEQTTTLTFTGNATEGTHYSMSPEDADTAKPGHQVVLATNTESVQITLTAIDDTVAGGDRTIEVAGSLNDAEFGRVTVTVMDDGLANTAPTASDATVTTDEDTAHVFEAVEFNFTDTDADATLASITLLTLPTTGALKLDDTSTTPDQVVTTPDIGKLAFTPETDENGTSYASFTLTSTFAYQWTRIAEDASETTIAGATNDTYTVAAEDVGARLRVDVEHEDDEATIEHLSNEETDTVIAAEQSGTCLAPDLSQRTEIWSATLTPETIDAGNDTIGYDSASGHGTLSDNTFSAGEVDFTILALFVVEDNAVEDNDGLALALSPTSTERVYHTVQLHICDTSVTIRSGGLIQHYIKYWPRLGLDWTAHMPISVAMSIATSHTPEFLHGNDSRSFAENAPAGTAVGPPITARDWDDDTLTYTISDTISGTDAAAFSIEEDTGQIRTVGGIVYDHESDQHIYEVIVTASDGTLSSSIDVTITLRDENEQAGTPDEPSVTPTQGTTDSLDVEWTEADRMGGPEIGVYNVQHRIVGTTDWEDFVSVIGKTSHTLSGLETDTEYEVQVQAVNGEILSEWSESGKGTTNATGSIAITANYTEIGAGLDDLVLTLTRAGPTTRELDATLTLTQSELWLTQGALTRTVTLETGTPTIEIEIPAAEFSLDPSSAGQIEATVSANGLNDSSLTLEVISTPAPAFTATYEEDEYTFNEDAPAQDVTIKVKVSLDEAYPRVPVGGIALAYATTDGTATAPDDYAALDVALQFAATDFADNGAGLEAVKELPGAPGSLTLVNDNVFEIQEEFKLTLATAPDGRQGLIEITEPDGYPVHILDPEDKPTLRLSATRIEIAEEDDTATPANESRATVSITINNSKTFSDDETFTLTFSGQAEQDIDYEITPGDRDATLSEHQLTLDAGTTSAAVTISAKADTTVEGDKAIVISATHEGVAIAPIISIEVIDNDFATPPVIENIEAISTPDYDLTQQTAGLYGADAKVEIAVEFDTEITVGATGTPSLKIEVNGQATPTRPLYERGSGSTEIVFAWAVDVDLEGEVSIPANALELNGATISEPGGTAAVLENTAIATLTHRSTGRSMILDSRKPRFESASVNNDVVNIVFDEDLDTMSIAPASAFTVEADGTEQTVASVTIATAGTSRQGTVKVTLVDNVSADATVTLDYAVPGTGAIPGPGAIKDPWGNEAAALNNEPVSNLTEMAPIEDNSDPVFEPTATTKDVAENTVAGTDIGDAVTAIDADNDTPEYTLEGVDAAEFDIHPDTGQIRTLGTLNHEGRQTYTVRVVADDGQGGSAGIDITINVTDVEEQAGVPGAPTVAPREISVTKLEVTWTEPDLAGGPEIVNYDVQWQVKDSEQWMSETTPDSATTFNITGLERGTEYEVKIRANNGEIPSGWSENGSGTTKENNLPSFEQTGNTTTRTINENTPPGTHIEEPITATDPDNDPLMYQLQGINADKFEIDSTNGQLKVLAPLDHEQTARYSVQVKVTDQSGDGGHKDVDVFLQDVDEPPLAPETPIVTGEDSTSLQIAWTAPDNSGRPDIEGYNTQYRKKGETQWVNGPQDITLTETTVSGLEQDTTHEARTQAVNDEGLGAWSEPGEGTTLSTDATLSGLELDDGNGTAVALSPGFSSETTSYTASVANSVSRITLTETPSDANAWVDYLDGDDTALTDLDTGKPGHQVDLVAGENTIQVKVTTEDGTTTQTYTVTVTRGGQTNTPATGKPSITGTAQVGETLTAATTGIADTDGKTKAENGDAGYAYTYQWVRVDADGVSNETDITGATSKTYLLATADVGKKIWVKVSFTDDAGNAEVSLTSDAYPEGSATITAANTPATGKPAITGTAQVGETLTAATTGITDADGKTKAENGDAGYAYAYQWVRVDGNTETDITGETSSTYTPVAADVDQKIKVKVSFTDDAGNPEGPLPSDAVATGTIENSDYMPKAWIARFGRTVGTQVVDALTQRLDGAGGSHVTVAGINLIGAKGEEPTLTDDDPFGLPEWAKNAEREADAQSITGEDLVLRSAFHLSSGGNAMQQGGGAFTTWGRVATAGFKAEEDDVTMDGDVTTGLVGFDAEWERGLAGIMLSRSSGDGSYRLDPAKGEDADTVESSLTGVYPYARVDLNAKVSAWALAGMGSGELTLRQTGKKPMPTDISMRMGALGVKRQVLDGSGPSGVAFNVKSDAMWVGTKSERSGDMIATQGDVMRLRLIIQGERTFEGGSGATFTPSAEVGLRHDGGDAETGTGVEVGAGLRYSIGSVTIEARARTLLAHEASDYDEWGMSGAIGVTPDASGRGLTLSIAPAWGRTGSAAQRLWSAHDARGLGADNEFEADSRLDMEAGYGFGLPGSRGVLTPYAGMTLGDAGHRAIRTGARWRLSPDAVLGLEGTRQTSDAGEAATEVKLRAALRF